MTNELDQRLLLKALSLAELGKGQCAPNPAVGAVIVSPAGELVATGYHQGVGKPHAEIEALKNASISAEGMTIYVTLEPCCHWGKTPPCTDALIQAGIKRVVYGYRDPNPLVSGKGIAQLTEQGIHCEHLPLPQINAFYASYQHWHETKQPLVTAKIALSLDGKIAGKAGKPIRITGDALQELTHFHRKTTDAILTTAKTIKNDNPQLNARYKEMVIPKRLYVLDSQLILPENAAVFATTASITVFHAREVSAERQQALANQGVRCIPVDAHEKGLNLMEVVQQIGLDGVHDLWVEAGGKCFSSFVINKLLRRALVYIAPRWVGEGVAAFADDFPMDELHAGSLSWRQFEKEMVLDIHYPMVNNLNSE